jgi:hypothetical protein
MTHTPETVAAAKCVARMPDKGYSEREANECRLLYPGNFVWPMEGRWRAAQILADELERVEAELAAATKRIMADTSEREMLMRSHHAVLRMRDTRNRLLGKLAAVPKLIPMPPPCYGNETFAQFKQRADALPKITYAPKG